MLGVSSSKSFFLDSTREANPYWDDELLVFHSTMIPKRAFLFWAEPPPVISPSPRFFGKDVGENLSKIEGSWVIIIYCIFFSHLRVPSGYLTFCHRKSHNIAARWMMSICFSFYNCFLYFWESANNASQKVWSFYHIFVNAQSSSLRIDTAIFLFSFVNLLDLVKVIYQIFRILAA